MSENTHDSQIQVYEPLSADHEQFVEGMINQGTPEDATVKAAYRGGRATGLAVASALEQEYKATHDHLTGLLNRRGVEIGIEEMLAQHHDVGVIVMDADKFKIVNDTLGGHKAGDAVLKEMADVLSNTLREVDLTAHEASRSGGDEFIVGVDLTPTENERRGNTEISPGERLIHVVGRIQEAFNKYVGEDRTLQKAGLNMSIGAALYKKGMTIEELVDTADQSMYRNKNGAVLLEQKEGLE